MRREVDFVALLDGMRTMFNEVLAREQSIPSALPHPHPVHFDYVDSNESNAIAVRCDQHRFIGVTIHYVRDAWTMCSTLAASLKSPSLFGLDADHESREGLAAALFRLQLTYVVCHEYAHHLNGDMADSGLFMEHGGPMQGNIQSQVREMHADGIAVFLCLRQLLLHDERQHILLVIGRKTLDEDRQDELLISLLIVAIGARIYRPVSIALDETNAYAATHPAAAARMNFVMRDVQQWCTHNRIRLVEWVTIDLFQKLMHGIDQVLADGKGKRWAQQTAFLQSSDGAVYMEILHAAFNRRLEERS